MSEIIVASVILAGTYAMCEGFKYFKDVEIARRNRNLFENLYEKLTDFPPITDFTKSTTETIPSE